ncbi:methyltransferase [Spiroplasma chinense]|uniref:Methyltransferase n=1 Tax=Spiroplasma chinense TaxID=216932 RepID=A0A5B9Y4Z5_9MOLU|nr:class I SAM-dependent methyltransferase [Spiroplasma chinense]QEH62030.1 methyltransferase [Spiroplasma chinense]
MENKYQKYSSLLYDATKPPGTSVDGDLEFYKEYILPVEGKVLEAGVGNGRMLIPFLKYKVDIIGIDKSNEMLELCEEHLKNNNLKSELICQSLETFCRPDEFEAIIMPNASFNLIETREKALIILQNYFTSLKKNGFVMIDLIFPSEFKVGVSHKLKHNVFDLEIEVENISKSINWEEQYSLTEVNYYIDSTLKETQNFKMSWYGIEEFKMILSNLGFSKIEVIKNYNKKSFINLKTATFIAYK